MTNVSLYTQVALCLGSSCASSAVVSSRNVRREVECMLLDVESVELPSRIC